MARSLGTVYRGDLAHAATEIVADQHRLLDAEFVEPSVEVTCLSLHRDIGLRVRHRRSAIADHLPCE